MCTLVPNLLLDGGHNMCAKNLDNRNINAVINFANITHGSSYAQYIVVLRCEINI